MEKARAGQDGGGRQAAQQQVIDLYRRVWAEAPLEAWGDRAGDRLEQIAATLPAPEAQLVRTHIATELVTRGMSYLRSQPQPGVGVGVRGGARGARADRRPRVQGALLPRAVGLEGAAAPARRAALRRGRRHLRQGRQPRSARQGAVPGGALPAPRPGTATRRCARYARIEAEHADHSYADDARLRMAELATRRRRRGGRRQDPGRGADPLPAGRSAERGAVAAGVLRPGAAAGSTRRLHWLDENLRLVPHEEIWYAEGRAQYWKGRVLEKQGHDDDARASYERAVREYPLSVYALLALARLKSVDAPREEALVASLRKGLKEVPAWSFPPRALFGDAASCAPSSSRAWARAATRGASWPRLGLATSADKHAAAAVAAAPGRGRGSPLDHRHAARPRPASGARRTRSPATADLVPARRTRRGSARRSGSSPTRAPSRRWSPRTRTGQRAPRGAASWRSCARRAPFRPGPSRSPTPSA